MRQLFNSQGLNFAEFLRKCRIPIMMKEFAIIFYAIPSGLRQLISNDLCNDSEHRLSNGLAINGVHINDKKCNNAFIRENCRETACPSCKTFWNSIYKDIQWKGIWNLTVKYCLINKVK